MLIFSQMTRQLDILEDYLASRDFDYERLDGSHSQAQREQSLRKFRKGDTFVFLLSTRAGGALLLTVLTLYRAIESIYFFIFNMDCCDACNR